MYERNAIVLERYFGKKLGYNDSNNLKINYNNYCDLLDKISNLGKKVEFEHKATVEFNNISNEIETIKSNQERLYKREAKLEYNRNILFSNIEEKPSELDRVFIKIEEDIKKTQDALFDLRSDFVEKVGIYQEKKEALLNAHREKQVAEKAYADSYRQTKETFESIDNGYIIYIKGINTEELRKIKKELIDVMTKNGEKEKVPFDPDVVSKAAEFATDIAKKEADILTYVFEKTGKLLEEIENKSFKPVRHAKWRKDATAELEFFNSEREYLIAFLDNERLPVMSGKKVHRKLMLEACRNLVDDVEQMNNLYELLLREEAGRSAKKAYKELYNIDYLGKIEASEKELEVQATKLGINAATLLNSNYWRLEGMRSIYSTFYSVVTEIYEKDLSEFEPVKEEVVEEPEEENTDDFELPKTKEFDKLEEISDEEEKESNEEPATEEVEEEPEKEEKVEEEKPKKTKAEELMEAMEELDEDIDDDVPSIVFDTEEIEPEAPKGFDIDRIFEKVERMRFSDVDYKSKSAKVLDEKDEYDGDEELPKRADKKEEKSEDKAETKSKSKKEKSEEVEEEPEKEEKVEEEKPKKQETKKQEPKKESKINLSDIEEDIKAEQEDEEIIESIKQAAKNATKEEVAEEEPAKAKKIEIEPEPEPEDDVPVISVEKAKITRGKSSEEERGFDKIESKIDELEDESDKEELDSSETVEKIAEEEDIPYEDDGFVGEDDEDLSDSLFQQYAKAMETRETLNAAFSQIKNQKAKQEKKKTGLFGFKKTGKKAKGEM